MTEPAPAPGSPPGGQRLSGFGPAEMVRLAADLRAAISPAANTSSGGAPSGGAFAAAVRATLDLVRDRLGEDATVQLYTGRPPDLQAASPDGSGGPAWSSSPEWKDGRDAANLLLRSLSGGTSALVLDGVLAFGGRLARGEGFAVVVSVHGEPIPAEALPLFSVAAVALQAILLELVVEEQAQALARQGERSRLDSALQIVGRQLTAHLDVDALVQDATDAARSATGAAFGAFFYNLVDEFGESYTLYTLSGAPREAFENFPMPRNTAVFAPTFSGDGIVRSHDITADSRYGRNEPYRGMPEGHLPVRSYLAVPVISPTSDEVLGGFFFGHPEPGRFTEQHARHAHGIAAYAAIGLDNARLYSRERNLATELQRSMLPVIPRLPGFQIVGRYLPAGTGSEVGGDWLDVIELSAGRIAFVIGDVMGRGIMAATVMGQIRAAVRAYALLDLPPADVLRHTSTLAESIPGHQFVTCVYAVYDPVDATLTYANAGHLPPALIGPDGTVSSLRERLGMPLRVGQVFGEQVVAFPPGSALLLYTDGLVEQPARPVLAGIEQLELAVTGLAKAAPPDASAATDRVIHDLTGGNYHDDVALLYVRDTAGHRPAATMPLTTDGAVAYQARRFLDRLLDEWGLAGMANRAHLIATELVSNAVRHSEAPVTLRVYRTGDCLVIDVADRDQRLPAPAEPSEESFHGLHIIEALAQRWGSRPTRDGKVVWAELAVEPL